MKKASRMTVAERAEMERLRAEIEARDTMPIGASTRTRGPHSTWEPLIVMPARLRRPGVRDWLSAQPGRGGGETLMGRKPLAFCAWLFELLGAAPQDELVDLFPGTGIVGRSWREFQATGANP